jgi:predicted DCC family thiol-disulfide oxidoreductase YuxK
MKVLKIYYDGDCYFCKRYTEFLKLKKFFDRVELISLRKNTEILKKFQSMGLKYNLGMVVECEDKFYFGDNLYLPP